MTESALLSVLGGVLGIALAHGALGAIRILASSNVPFIHEARLDGAAVLFTITLSLLTALVFGFLPAVQQSRIEAAESLRTGARTTGGCPRQSWHWPTAGNCHPPAKIQPPKSKIRK